MIHFSTTLFIGMSLGTISIPGLIILAIRTAEKKSPGRQKS